MPPLTALFTDLYELTMAQAYHAEGMNETAVFEIFFRKLPESRNFVVTGGLEDVLAFLDEFHLTGEDIDYLRKQPSFSEPFLEWLRSLRFTGDVAAMREGTVVFPSEPVVQITAPIIEAQLLETYLLNQLHFQSIAFTKAARVVNAAKGRTVVDFGTRRAHGSDAALKFARATYLTGGQGTSNVMAGRVYGLPIFGTMAHSYIQAHDDEAETFKKFAELYPNTTLLVDTYDTLNGVRKVIDLMKRTPKMQVGAVRLDSGDLVELSKQTRRMLNAAGLESIKIFASSGLDEYGIAELLEQGAPIDGFGVGTKMVVSEDAPYLDFAYKLVEYGGSPRIKLASEKESLPGRKQVFRRYANGQMAGDLLARVDEDQTGVALLQPVMKGGQRLSGSVSDNEAVREYVRRQMQALPPELLNLHPPLHEYPVAVSETLLRDLETAKARLSPPKP